MDTDDDDAALIGTTDAIKPWTLKAMPNEVRNMAIAAARAENMTASQWIERVIRERVAAGRPAPSSGNGPRINVHDLTELVAAARGLGDLPPEIAKPAGAAIREALRQTRGLPPLKPRQPPAPRIGHDKPD